MTKRRKVIVQPADAPPGVEFVSEPIGSFVSRLRERPGKDIVQLHYRIHDQA